MQKNAHLVDFEKMLKDGCYLLEKIAVYTAENGPSNVSSGAAVIANLSLSTTAVVREELGHRNEILEVCLLVIAGIDIPGLHNRAGQAHEEPFAAG